MFVAKFTQTSGAPFVADKNGNFPFIGTVVAGKATGSIINGTIAKREGIVSGKLYACENSVDPEYPDNVQTTMVSAVSILELVELRKELGTPSTVTVDADAVGAEA